MAEIPLPIGIGAVLVDLANGIGEAARALPERSQSLVGAVALKTAKVRIDFELAQVSNQRDSGLGIRTSQILGIGTVENATVTRGASRGFIEFEVVAISTPVEPDRQDPAEAAAFAEAKAEARREKKAKAEALAGAEEEARKKAGARAEAAKAEAIAEAKEEARKKAEGRAEAAKAEAIAEAKDEARKKAGARAAESAKAKPASGRDG